MPFHDAEFMPTMTWNAGDGSGDVTQTQFYHQYTDAGTYIITCTGVAMGVTYTSTQVVTIV